MIIPMRALFILAFLLAMPIALAQPYYADIEIDVDNSGFTTITGSTNHPGLIAEDTPEYTSKTDSNWLLNITKTGEFSNYVYRLTLPSSSSINYVKSSGQFRIEQTGSKMAVKGFGQEKPFYIIVQYSLNKTKNTQIALYIILAAIAIITLIALRKKLPNPIKEKETYKLKGLTARQKQIAELLIKAQKPMTQSEIKDTLKLPKASISRNIKSMELKGTIEVEKAGMTRIIKMKPVPVSSG